MCTTAQTSKFCSGAGRGLCTRRTNPFPLPLFGRLYPRFPKGIGSLCPTACRCGLTTSNGKPPHRNAEQAAAGSLLLCRRALTSHAAVNRTKACAPGLTRVLQYHGGRVCTHGREVCCLSERQHVKRETTRGRSLFRLNLRYYTLKKIHRNTCFWRLPIFQFRLCLGSGGNVFFFPHISSVFFVWRSPMSCGTAALRRTTFSRPHHENAGAGCTAV